MDSSDTSENTSENDDTGSIHIKYNEVIIEDSSLKEMLLDFTSENNDEIKKEEEFRYYYRDIVNIAIQIHDTLKISDRCSCSNTVLAQTACCVIFPGYAYFTRGPFFIMPTYALFDSDTIYNSDDDDVENDRKMKRICKKFDFMKNTQNKKKDVKKKKVKRKNKKNQYLCIMAVYKDNSSGSMHFIHHDNVYLIDTIKNANMWICPYDSVVGNEIWEMAVCSKTKTVKNDYSECSTDDHEEDDENESIINIYGWDSKEDTINSFVGIDIKTLWTTLPSFFSNTSECNSVKSTNTKLPTSAFYATTSLFPVGLDEEKHEDIDIYTDVEIEKLNILRDVIVLNSLRLRGLVNRRIVLLPDNNSSSVTLPNEATVVDTEATFISTCLSFSIVFFKKSEEAKLYAQKYGFYIGAHDLIEKNGAKNFFVTSSLYSAYETIRLGETSAPPECMFTCGYNRKMRFSHDVILPERRTKLYIDIDINLEDNPQFCSPDVSKIISDSENNSDGDSINGYMYNSKAVRSQMITSDDTVNQITLSVMVWIADLFGEIFGIDKKPDDYEKDWIVLCATDKRKKISRHLILDKPGCFFNTKLDLMAFMNLAKFKLSRDMKARNRSDDNSFYKCVNGIDVYNENPMSWMTCIINEIDTFTHCEMKRETSIIDFEVYKEFSLLRGYSCGKIDDPERTLNRVDITSLIKKGQNPMLSGGSRNMVFVVQKSGNIPLSTASQIEIDFEFWKRSSVQCITGGDPTERGLTLPLDKISSIRTRLSSKDKSKYCNISSFKNKRSLESFGASSWMVTSSIPKGKCSHYFNKLIKDRKECYKIHGISAGGGMGPLGSWAYSCELVDYDNHESVDEENEYAGRPRKTLRHYFAQKNIDERISNAVNTKPWAVCKSITLVRKYDMRSVEERNLQTNRSNPSLAKTTTINGKCKTRRKTNYNSSSYSSSSIFSNITPTVTHEENKNGRINSQRDHILVKFKGTKWCPIARRDHSVSGKVFLKIYRGGKVVCSCYSTTCRKKMNDMSTNGRECFYWPLVPLTKEQNNVFWPNGK